MSFDTGAEEVAYDKGFEHGQEVGREDLEAVIRKSKPGSFLNLAFDSGRLYERNQLIKLLEDNHLTAASELIEQHALTQGENA